MNFASVAMALNDLGYRALGVRIDSGDLAYLSIVAREAFESISKQVRDYMRTIGDYKGPKRDITGTKRDLKGI